MKNISFVNGLIEEKVVVISGMRKCRCRQDRGDCNEKCTKDENRLTIIVNVTWPLAISTLRIFNFLSLFSPEINSTSTSNLIIIQSLFSTFP